MHKHTRRDFFSTLIGRTLAGASILELASHRAAWAQAMSATASTQLFDIEKAAGGVYFAHALPQAEINCNAAIFVNSGDVLVVDAHSKPSAAASLIAQIKKEITPKPVRYVVNSHFHWDHTQGNHAYRTAETKIDFIASDATKQLLSDLGKTRLEASLNQAQGQIDALRGRAANSSNPAEKAFCEEQIRQLQAYRAEMQNYTLELPTITFATSHVIKDKAHDLHIEYHGHAHTAGDVVVFCPQKRVVATGDMIHGFLPFIADGFPKSWPQTIDSVATLDFAQVLPGHGPLHPNRQTMTSLRNYIDELTGKVAEGKQAGKSVADLQRTITVASLNSMQSNGYAKFLVDVQRVSEPNFGPPAPLQNGVNANIADIYKNLDRV
ncbi:MAG: MBL fold metallo-hydrolase [Bryobacteraceae bacterium]|jgi:glyoxylase-like metal-dependent hydrolase (beta-lactamase superfamily II)